MNLSLWRTKRARILEGDGNDAKGCVLALTGKASDAVQMITSGDHRNRDQREQRVWMPLYLSYLARAHAEIGQFDDAWRCIGEAMTAVETTKERWCEAEINRIAGEIALLVAGAGCRRKRKHISSVRSRSRRRSRQSPGNSRAAMSMARLWRDQGKRQTGPRPSRSGLWLVHRRLRHARLEAGEGVA